MTNSEHIKEIIDLTLQQVLEQGWEIIDNYCGGYQEKKTAINKVYDKIKDEL